MSSTRLFRIGLAIVASVIAFVLTLLWNDYPGSELQPTLEYGGVAADGTMTPVKISHYIRVPSKIEVVTKITVLLAALMGVAVFAARIAVSHKIAAGTCASVCSGLLSIIVLHAIAAKFDGGSYIPNTFTLVAAGGISLLIGSLASWTSLKWWPDKLHQ